jgi:hypothetical protein
MEPIKIEGLTRRQQMICDLLWSCDYLDDVERLIKAMPDDAQHDARVMFELIIAAEYDEIMEITPEITELLNQF